MSDDLYIACFEDDEETVKMLLSNPDPKKYDYNDALQIACIWSKPEIVEMLLADTRVDPSYKNSEALKDACRNNRPEIVKILLDDGRVDHSESLSIACDRGYKEIVEIFLQNTVVTGIFYSENLLQSIIKETTNGDIKILISNYIDEVKHYKKNIIDSTNNLPAGISGLLRRFVHNFNKLKSRNRKSMNRKSRNRKSGNKKSVNRKSRNKKSGNKKSRNKKSRNKKSGSRIK